MGYYFNTIRDDSSKTFRNHLTDVYGTDPIITSHMAISYSQIFLLATAMNIVYSYDISAMKSVMGFCSYNGPGGKISWNNEGLSIAKVKLGKINGNGEIEVVDDGFDIPLSYSYTDLSMKCDWSSSSGSIITRETAKIVFLHILNDNSREYDFYYTQYFNLMINLLNENYGGIDSKIIKGIMPHISSESELKEYMENIKYDDIIAFMGTCRYLF